MNKKKLLNFISLLIVFLGIGIYAINNNKDKDNTFYIKK